MLSVKVLREVPLGRSAGNKVGGEKDHRDEDQQEYTVGRSAAEIELAKLGQDFPGFLYYYIKKETSTGSGGCGRLGACTMAEMDFPPKI